MIKKIIIFVFLVLSVFVFSPSVFAQEGNSASSSGSNDLNNPFREIEQAEIQEDLSLQEEILLPQILPQNGKSFIVQKIEAIEREVFVLKILIGCLGIIIILFGFFLFKKKR